LLAFAAPTAYEIFEVPPPALRRLWAPTNC
jgi:hypothetical protein